MALALCIYEVTETFYKILGGDTRCNNFFNVHNHIKLNKYKISDTEEYADDTSKLI